jgi:hypothetical protein
MDTSTATGNDHLSGATGLILEDAGYRPFHRAGLGRRLGAMAAVAVAAEASLALPPGPMSTVDTAISVSLLVATAAAVLLLPWDRLPSWSTVVVPLTYLGSVLTLILAAGGANAGRPGATWRGRVRGAELRGRHRSDVPGEAARGRVFRSVRRGDRGLPYRGVGLEEGTWPRIRGHSRATRGGPVPRDARALSGAMVPTGGRARAATAETSAAAGATAGRRASAVAALTGASPGSRALRRANRRGG